MNPLRHLLIRVHTSLLRAFKGKAFSLGGRVLLLTTVGAKTGKVRTNPLVYIEHDGGYLVAASAAGSPKNPGWFYNLKKTPDVEVEIDGVRREMRATIVEGDARDALWEKFTEFDRRYKSYQAKTDRTIPVVVLKPRSGESSPTGSGHGESAPD